jgi:hypothetical protein
MRTWAPTLCAPVVVAVLVVLLLGGLDGGESAVVVLAWVSLVVQS